jgi:hypothetical protein
VPVRMDRWRVHDRSQLGQGLLAVLATSAVAIIGLDCRRSGPGHMGKQFDAETSLTSMVPRVDIPRAPASGSTGHGGKEEVDMLVTSSDAREMAVAMQRFLQTADTVNRNQLLKRIRTDSEPLWNADNHWSISGWVLVPTEDYVVAHWHMPLSPAATWLVRIRLEKKDQRWVATELKELHELADPKRVARDRKRTR